MLKYSARQHLGNLGVATPPSTVRPVSFTMTIHLECVDSNYGSWAVKPPPERKSVRCWAAPHTPGCIKLDSAKFSGTGFPLCGGSFGLFQFKIREVDRQIDPAIDEGSQSGVVS